MPGVDEEYFQSRERIADLADRFAAIERSLVKRGFSLHYHTYHHEFAELDGTTAFDVFLNESPVSIELDHGLTLLSGENPTRLKSLDDRSTLAYVKAPNLDEQESVPFYDGTLNLTACIDSYRAIDGKWLVCEYKAKDPLDSLGDDINTLRTAIEQR